MLIRKPELTNFFINLIHPNYDANEISRLLDSFDWHSANPSCQRIMNLLKETKYFLLVTVPDDAFLRKQNRHIAKDIKNLFDKITRSFEEFEASLVNEVSQNEELCTSALEYCLKAISLRIDALNVEHDDIYIKYWPASTLRNFIDNKKKQNNQYKKNDSK